jgi:hypothetical protein
VGRESVFSTDGKNFRNRRPARPGSTFGLCQSRFNLDAGQGYGLGVDWSRFIFCHLRLPHHKHSSGNARFSEVLQEFLHAADVADISSLLRPFLPLPSLWIARSQLPGFLVLAVAFVLDRAGTDQPVCKILRSRPLVHLGTISYMFYLMHAFVFRLISGSFRNYLLARSGPNRLLQSVEGVLSLALTVLVAELSWRYFESPILRLKSRFGSKQKESKVATTNAEPLVPLLASVREGIEIT